jgi:hypothetical protein
MPGAPRAKEHVEFDLTEIGVERAQAADLSHQPGVGLGGSALFGRAGLRCQGGRVAALGLEGGLPAVEGAARDTKGVTGRRQAVLVEETKNFKASVGIFGCHAPKMPQSRYPVKPPDAIPNVVDLHGTPPGSQECQRFLSLCSWWQRSEHFA